ncbi:MAG: hypothetical protein JSU94_10275 [Phycisphaerales bacterium]|nr:MAG: hypothetical protein JSU94_10275 [Phycisphaerales bacterium]
MIGHIVKRRSQGVFGVLLKTGWLVLLPALSGAGAGSAGRLEICPEHPYYFRDGDRHVVLVGVSDRALFSVWRNDKGFSWRNYLDDIAAHRLNYVRQDVFSWGKLRELSEYPAQFSNVARPFVRAGPGTAVDGKAKFDLTKFNQSYFDERLKPFLREAAERGIYVELTLFEGFRSRRDFEQSLYAAANNVNKLGLRPGAVTSDAALANRELTAIQERYVDKVLGETAGFGNVIYEIANEAGGKLWVSHFIEYIHSHPEHRGRLVSAGEQGSSFDPRSGANDIVVKHRGKAGLYATDADVRNHHASLVGYRAGKPVSHNEYFLYANRSTDDVNFPRKMMWADFTAGGHSNFFDFSFWRGTGRTIDDGRASCSPPEAVLGAGRGLVDFLSRNGVEFWSMAPHDELAGVEAGKEAYVLTIARPGREYVCYVLGDGPVTVTVDLNGGRFIARWYDPKNGRFLTEAARVGSEGRCELVSPPFAEDIVLYIFRSES